MQINIILFDIQKICFIIYSTPLQPSSLVNHCPSGQRHSIVVPESIVVHLPSDVKHFSFSCSHCFSETEKEFNKLEN